MPFVGHEMKFGGWGEFSLVAFCRQPLPTGISLIPRQQLFAPSVLLTFLGTWGKRRSYQDARDIVLSYGRSVVDGLLCISLVEDKLVQWPNLGETQLLEHGSIVLLERWSNVQILDLELC